MHALAVAMVVGILVLAAIMFGFYILFALLVKALMNEAERSIILSWAVALLATPAIIGFISCIERLS